MLSYFDIAFSIPTVFASLKNPSNNRIKIVGNEFTTDKSNILQIIY
jgi:hypothetical protein